MKISGVTHQEHWWSYQLEGIENSLLEMCNVRYWFSTCIYLGFDKSPDENSHAVMFGDLGGHGIVGGQIGPTKFLLERPNVVELYYAHHVPIFMTRQRR